MPTVPRITPGVRGLQGVSLANVSVQATDPVVLRFQLTDGSHRDVTVPFTALSGDGGPVSSGEISDATAVGQAILTAEDNAEVKDLLGILAGDITDATTVGRAVLRAADAGAVRTLLGLAATVTKVAGQSPNGQGEVTLTAAHIAETADRKWLTPAERAQIGSGGGSLVIVNEPVIAPAPPPPPTVSLRHLGHPLWNQPIGSASHPFWTTANPAAPATSAQIVGNLAWMAGFNQNPPEYASRTSSPLSIAYNWPSTTKTNDAEFGIPVALVDVATTPKQSVLILDPGAGKQEFQAEINAQGGVRIPNPADIPGGIVHAEGSDGPLWVIYAQRNGSGALVPTGEAWSFWKLRAATQAEKDAGHQWAAMQGARMVDKETHPGIWTSYPAWGVSASGIDRLGVVLKWEDWLAVLGGGDIKHPLAIGIPLPGGAGTGGVGVNRYLPATRNDTGRAVNEKDDPLLQEAINARQIPEGTWLRLDPVVWTNAAITTWVNSTLPDGTPRAVDDPYSQLGISQLGARRPGKAVLAAVMRAARDYGIVVQDRAGVVTITAEHEKYHGTKYHPAAPTAPKPAWNNVGAVFPWSGLKQLPPPTLNLAVPKG